MKNSVLVILITITEFIAVYTDILEQQELLIKMDLDWTRTHNPCSERAFQIIF